MRRLIIMITLLSFILVGCSSGLDKEEVIEALKRGESSFTVDIGTGNIVDFMSEVFRSDVLILGEDIHFQYGYNNEYKGSFLPEYADELIKRRSKIKFKLTQVINNDYFKKMSEYEKVMYLNDYVVANVRYDDRVDSNGKPLEASFSDYPESFDIYGATVNGVAVCRGYAEMLHYLLTEAGFESQIAVGTFKGVSHAWIKIKFDGDWLNIDPTANDSEIPYYTFLRTDAELIGYVENPSNDFTTVPKSLNLESKYEYYAYNNLLVTSVDQAVKLIKEGNSTLRFSGVTSSQLLASLEILPELNGRTYYLDGDVFKVD